MSVLALTANPLLRPPTPKPEKKADEPRPGPKTAHVLRRTAARRDLKHQLDVANAAKELGTLPGPEESVHVVMRGNFHGWDLIPAVLRLAAPATIETLYVATLGFNKQNGAELLDMLDTGKVGRVTFLCSCYFRDSCPDEFTLLATGLADRGQPIVATRNHAKVQLCGLTDGRRIVVESSANLRSCRNIEQFCMTQSASLFDFHRAWMDEVTQAVRRDRQK